MKILKLFFYVILIVGCASAASYEEDNKKAIQVCLEALESNDSHLIENGVLDDDFDKANVIRYSHSQFIWLRFCSSVSKPKVEISHLPPISCAVNKISLTVSMLAAPENKFSNHKKEYLSFSKAETDSEKKSIEELNGAGLKIVDERNYFFMKDKKSWARSE